jgi:hypothetical protein
LETVQTPISNPKPLDSFIDAEKIYTDKESLDYKGFNISKQYKKRKFENGKPVDVVFAVIQKNNNQIFEFDAYLDDNVREIRFGLFPLLGDENNKQLIVESAANRYWGYAVINLSPKFEVLFDSRDYSLMQDLRITDIDKDGKYELIQDLSTFYYFGISYRKGFAATTIIFKYDEKKRKYIFANPEFADYLLNPPDKESSIEEKIARIKESKAHKSDAVEYNSDLFTSVMNVFLTYVYLGRQKEAWAYFEEYDLSDKEAVRAEIKKYLKKDNLYRHTH